MFTLNNPLENDHKGAWLPDSEYWVIGKEVGASGTPHLQGYVVFMDRYRLAQIQKFHPTCAKCHWETQSKFSTPKQAADYCKKDGDFEEHGEWYLLLCDMDVPELMSSDTESMSSTSYSSHESDDEDQDNMKPLKRTLTSSMHMQTCDGQLMHSTSAH